MSQTKFYSVIQTDILTSHQKMSRLVTVYFNRFNFNVFVTMKDTVTFNQFQTRIL